MGGTHSTVAVDPKSSPDEEVEFGPKTSPTTEEKKTAEADTLVETPVDATSVAAPETAQSLPDSGSSRMPLPLAKNCKEWNLASTYRRPKDW